MAKPSLGEYIKKIRTEKNLNLTELAKLVGISRPYLSQIESEKKGAPSLQILNKIAEVLQVSPYEIGWVADYYTDSEYISAKSSYEYEEYLKSLTPEEVVEIQKKELEDYDYFEKLNKFIGHKYVEIESFLNDNYRGIYIGGHKLTNGEINMLVALFDGKEKNYPSFEDMQAEFDSLREERRKEIKESESFFVMSNPDTDYLD